MNDYIIVIPARMKSKRLPGKPLIELYNGMPMIVLTYLRVLKAEPNYTKIYVATDSEEIKDVCEKWNIQVLMTSEECTTGTDRIAEVSRIIDSEIYINVQGDEPVIPADDIKSMIKEGLKNKDKTIIGYHPITTSDYYNNVNIPKVLFSKNKRLLYTSRSPIPGNKSKMFQGECYRQICLYSFPKKVLSIYNNTKTPLEDIEDLEILRLIENDYNVYGIELSDKSIAVDVPEDVKKVRNFLSERGLHI